MSRASRQEARVHREENFEVARTGLVDIQLMAAKLVRELQRDDRFPPDVSRDGQPKYDLGLDGDREGEVLSLTRVADKPSRLANAIRKWAGRPPKEPTYDWSVSVPIGEPGENTSLRFMLLDRRPGTAIVFKGKGSRLATAADVKAAQGVLQEQIFSSVDS